MTGRRVLIAGVGNVLRRDDGFGVVVAQRAECRLAGLPGVRVIETGIGGVAMVQELMDGFDALFVADIVRRDGVPGSLYVLAPQVPDPGTQGGQEAAEFLSDLHRADPSRGFGLAAALGVLPAMVRIIACEPLECDEAEIGLTAPVAAAVDLAVDWLYDQVQNWTEMSAEPVGTRAGGW
ncbi:MAG: hydrogenase maturation protease [Chloroflexota bacterium]